MVKQIALRTQAHDLASGAKTGVDSQYALLPKGSRQQQLSRIISKHANRFFVGFELGCRCIFRLDSGFEQALIRILHGYAYLLGTRIVSFEENAVKLLHGFLLVGRNIKAQESFCFASSHGEQTMALNTAQPIFSIEIIVVLLGSFVGLLSFDYLTRNHRAVIKLAANSVSRILTLIHPFGNDVSCSLKGFFFGQAAAIRGAEKTRSRLLGLQGRGLRHKLLCERFEPFFSRHIRTRLPMRFVG